MSKESSPKNEFITIPEIAEHLRVSQMSVRRMIARGELAGVQVGRQWRIPTQAMDTMLAAVKASLDAQFAQAKDKAERNKHKAEQRAASQVSVPLAHAVVADATLLAVLENQQVVVVSDDQLPEPPTEITPPSL
jgi:excisionase family DNA binding protein